MDNRKRRRTLVRLPSNFKCADVICDLFLWLSWASQIRDNKGHKYRTKDHSWRSLGSAKGADGIGRITFVSFSKGNHPNLFYPSEEENKSSEASCG
jgi:hypothetical protein